MNKRKASSISRPNKRLNIGAKTDADSSARLVSAQHLAEHQGNGQGYLSTRESTTTLVKSLKYYSLNSSAEGILQVLKVPKVVDTNQAHLVGWNPNREKDNVSVSEMASLREFIQLLPVDLANTLLEKVLKLSSHISGEGAQEDTVISVLALATLFLHSNTTRLSLSNLSAPTLFLNKIPNCTFLQSLDLSSTNINDSSLAKILALVPTVEVVNFRGCTKVGDLSCIALAKASEDRLKSVNLSLTASTIKGLTSILARCKSLEVLKLANVAGLNEKAITKLVDDSITYSSHIPLSNLKTLKLRSTEVSDSSLGRLLSLCSSLTSLDISYSHVKTLDILSQALFTRTTPWKLQKLVASGLPLSPTSMQSFFEPLSLLPLEERKVFQTLKLGALTSTSNKQPGLTDQVLEKILPFLEKLEGLEHISFYQNYGLGRNPQPMGRFIEVCGKRCLSLDLTLPLLEPYHLDGFFPAQPFESIEELAYDGPARLQTLILNGTKIDDKSAAAISQCKDLRGLFMAETKISTVGVTMIMKNCPLLSTINLTSCRGIPVSQRRNWFQAYAKGETE